MQDDRASLQALLAALDASPRALRREPLDGRNKADDQPTDYAVHGTTGRIYADRDGYLVVITTGESARRWGNVKRSLPFCKVRQDGDDEGCLRLDRLPAPHEAVAIREALGIRKKRRVSEETREAVASRLSEFRYKMASHGSGSREMARPVLG